jgi:hypothetical protein
MLPRWSGHSLQTSLHHFLMQGPPHIDPQRCITHAGRCNTEDEHGDDVQSGFSKQAQRIYKRGEILKEGQEDQLQL